MVEFYGESEAELKGKMDALQQDMARRRMGYACVNVLDKAGQAAAWNLRKAGLGLLMSITGDAKPFPYVEDSAVDPERLGEFVGRFDEVVRSHDTTAAYYGHASVGCLHVRPLVSLKGPEGIARMEAIADEISDLVKEFGGSLSGEHGDGIVRGVWTEKMFGPQLYQAFREVKRAFDPQGIMNPGKIIDCPPMTENLRYGADYRAASLPTRLDYSLEGDYAAAVEMCNGMATCRKLEGSMCPSYMATREEEHSTRGRANLLRAALSGRLPENAISSRRLYQALDLCLECKACKAECESGVDMARLKAEFLDNFYRSNPRPLASRMFANIDLINRWGSRLAPFSNWAARSPVGKLTARAILGVDTRRSMSPFSRQTLSRWFGARGEPKPGAVGRGEVVLFNDTFMEYNYPEVGEAAVEVLEAAGFRVTLANAGCCGRPRISQGMMAEAQERARRVVDLLYPYAVRGIAIVGCEPSCVLTFRDEYPQFLKDEKSRVVAEHTYLAEEFLMTLRQRGELDLKFGDTARKVLFHGHCHQKALAGVASSVSALGLPSGHEVEQTNAGCCGMAGSFGYLGERYDVSMAIGGQALFPAVNAKGDDWEVAVTGVSCRQQIEQGTGRKARHVVEILRDALG